MPNHPVRGLSTLSSRAKRGICFFFALVCLFAASSVSAQSSTKRPRIIALAFVRLHVTDLDKSLSYYTQEFQLGFHLKDCLGQRSVCLRWNELQKIELTETAESSHASELEEVGLSTNDICAMRRFAVAQGLRPSELARDWDGQQRFYVIDPEGHRIAFVSPPLAGSYVSWPSQISARLIHAGLIVHDRPAMEHFYKDILGFRPYWHGGRTDDRDDWVSLQVPNGSDWVEFMLNVPDNADKRTLGVANHIALGVRDIQAAKAQLLKNGVTLTEEPKIGRGGKWQLNVFDPDGTRIEFMEFTPVQKPCCSEYTAPHPKP